MSGWMYLWITLLVAGSFGMVGLLLTVTVGAFAELRQMLAELQPETSEAAGGPTASPSAGASSDESSHV